ncbi:hypothetical protein QQ045_000796 [Rhodiola kirilowii]
MISGYAQNGLFKEALEVFSEMQVVEDVSPNYVTLVTVLPAMSGLGALGLGEWVHLYAEKMELRLMKFLVLRWSICILSVEALKRQSRSSITCPERMSLHGIQLLWDWLCMVEQGKHLNVLVKWNWQELLLLM